MKKVKPKIVNHGKAFGNKNWYTFYCPVCGKQISSNTCECGQEIDIT